MMMKRIELIGMFCLLVTMPEASFAECIELKPFPELSAPRAVTSGPHDHFLANYFAINAWSPDNRIDVTVSGAAKFKGICNGDATSLEPFVKPTMRAFHGELTGVIESGAATGPVRISVFSEGLRSADVGIVIKQGP